MARAIRRKVSARSCSCFVKGLQDFNHPVTSMIPSAVIDHRPGFEDYHLPEKTDDTEKKNEHFTTLLLPKSDDPVPRISVAQRILQSLAKELELNPQPLPPG